MDDIGYTSAKRYLKERYGGYVRRIPIDAGFTCPNRDGRCGVGGCIFCRGGGAGAGGVHGAVAEQLRKAKSGASMFMAYFQSYTNTYAPVSELSRIYEPAMRDPSVVCISIATRPDCLDDDVVALLHDMNRTKDVFIELGLQTASDKTAAFINRGYGKDVFRAASKRLQDAGIERIVHMMLGLPFEGRAEADDTCDEVLLSGAKGIKIHSLYYEKGARILKMYEDYIASGGRDWHIMSLDEYAEAAARAVLRLGRGVVVHRLTGDADRSLLVYPKWAGNKIEVRNAIAAELTRQGSRPVSR